MSTRALIAWPFVVLLAAPLAPVRAQQSWGATPEPEPPWPGEETPAEPAEVGPPPPETQPPAQQPTQASFDQSLAPYGQWLDTPEYGRVWTPNEPSDWQPYTDGRWVFTDLGWTFASAVPWGRVVFHYGRWGFRAGVGWFWVPGFQWSPAWVSWRTSNSYVCWSPLGPVGFAYPTVWPGWVAMPTRTFTRPIRAHAVPPRSAPVAMRGARPGWAGAPPSVHPDYRRAHSGPVHPQRGRETHERHR
jgi:hypothetical protein